MRKLFVILFTAITALSAISDDAGLIPQPASWCVAPGAIRVPEKVTIATTDKHLCDAASVAALQMRTLGIDCKLSSPDKAFVRLSLDKGLSAEQYRIRVQPDGVKISSGDAAGAFYALHSLKQMILNSQTGVLSCGEMTDKPRFEYRGIMLDVSRYFIPMEEVKRVIDVASQLKISKLHLHLTDDNGWRMEIKRYPLLTDVGAWRVARNEIFPGRMNPLPGEKATEGGFYTHNELKDMVKYAAERFIDVIPEIEMPAHSIAALAAYPNLACPIVDKFIGVLPGIGGKNASIVFCAGNDDTFTFIENVLDEVLEVFPSEYIHIGGDEASKEHWNQCPLCQKRIADEHLADSEELQGYFMDRINRYLQSKGRKSIGWDEVSYGKPKEDIVVFGWQGMGTNAVDFASKCGRRFVMTPARKLYLIRYQGPQWFEPLTYFGDNTLSDVYSYEPVQADWSAAVEQLLWGVQASLWTEFCHSPEDVEYLLFPRLIAFADMAWRGKGTADWHSFEHRLDNYLPQLEKLGVTYARSMYNLYHKAKGADGSVKVDLSCIRDDVDTRFTADGSEPVASSPLFTESITIAHGTTLKAATFRAGKRCGEVLTLNFGINSASGCQITSESSNNGLEYVLTNGLRGSNRNSDSEWVGWHNRTAEFTVDLGCVKPISSIALGSLANSTLCVAAPAVVSAYVSNDNKVFSLLKSVAVDKEARFSINPRILDIDFGKINVSARYVKFVAVNSGCIPEGYAREGAPTWLYFDEIIIN